MSLEKKSTPIRTCIACKARKPKYDLLRFVLQENKVIPDAKQRMQGRGAYLCASKECLSLAIKNKLFARVFRRQVNIDKNQLQEELEQWLILKE